MMELEKRISKLPFARQQVTDLQNKNKQSFPFKTFITKLNAAFQTLAECGETYMEKTKVDQLIKVMQQCSNTAIIAAMTNVMMNEMTRSNFVAVANKMTIVVAQTFPAVLNSCRGRNVSFIQAGGRGCGHSQGERLRQMWTRKRRRLWKRCLYV